MEAKNVLEANANFTKDLYKILSKKEGNIFFSPISIHAVLAMLHQGARGETAHALLHTLKCTEPEGYKAVLGQLNSVDHVKLMMANKIYGNKNKTRLLKNFETMLKECFSSEVEFLDPIDQKASAKTVNEWVEKKTDHKIKNIVNEQSFNNNLSLMLINAIYFKGKWASQFQDSSTRKADFFVDKNSKIEVQMMYQKGEYGYKYDQQLDSQIIEIPYRGLDTYMVVILPSESSSIEKLEDKLIAKAFSDTLNNLKVEEVHLYLPKFKIEKTIKLNDILTEMGLGNIFDMKKANFEGMVEGTPLENLFVSEIIQKAYIQVDETGTEAAAATKAGLMLGSAPGASKPIVFKVNRPAIFMLIANHDKDRALLFYGRLTQPQF